MASFTPAILAPIFVLVAIIFGSREFSGGGKKFGVIVLCLALLQGWFVLDHFGHLSGTLGITTAKDADSQAAAKYASVSLDLPVDYSLIIESKCNEEWPADYKMKQYCITKQGEATKRLSNGAPSDVDASAFHVIRGKCSDEWPRDFQMRSYCESQQFEGYRSLRASVTSDPVRNACAQQWPEDYKMRRYCENKGK